MAASRIYRFEFIAPGETGRVFIHGYSEKDAVNYSAVVSGIDVPQVLSGPLGHINITQGETFRHVDGTVARMVYVENLAPSNPCLVDILEVRESF
jgi:hypothetical protein